MIDYREVRREIGGGRSYLLLGNGFSIGCDPIFRYESLYASAVEAGLGANAQAVFERLGTSNFEGVLRLLEDAEWIADLYGADEADHRRAIRDDIAVVKRTLVQAVAQNHLEHTGHVSDDKKAAANSFFEPYQIVFTTNYDLLAYWVTMSRDPIRFQDGFREDEDDPDGATVIFSERLGGNRGLLYLHGGLHLFLDAGELNKRCWSRTQRPLIELIREGLENEEYPLFVAEGSAESKLGQIQRVGYLWYALDKLSRIQSPLIVYGHSLGPSDQHIRDAIVRNVDLKRVYIGVHGGEESPSYEAALALAASLRDDRDAYRARRGSGHPLSVGLFASESAAVWG